jgi:putative PEP-CTERM system TPR-repeat lipoprotein
MRGHTAFITAATLTGLISIGVAPACAAPDTDGLLQSAQSLVAKNDLKGAEAQLRLALKRAPQDGSLRVELARVYLRQGDTAGAEAELLAAKQLGIISDDLVTMLAETMFKRGQLGELLREVPARDRRPAVESIVRTYRGMAQLALKNVNDAQKMLEDAERLDPKATPPKIAMARLLLNKNDLSAADRKLDEALTLAPRDVSALILKGNIALSHTNPTDAMAYFNRALTEAPDEPLALIARTDFYLAHGDLDRAEKDLQTLVKTNKNKGDALYLSAELSERRGDYAAADAALNKIRKDSFPESYLLAGMVKYRLNQTEQATTYLTRYIARRQDSRVAYLFLGANLLKQGNPDRALPMLERAFKLGPNNPNTPGVLSQAHMALGDSARGLLLLDNGKEPGNTSAAAIAELQDIFSTSNGPAAALQVLAALREGRTDQAAATAETLVKQEPDNLPYQQLLGATRVAQHNLPDAEKTYRSILEKQPNLSGVRRSLAQVYLTMKRPADAKKLFQDKIAKDADDAESMAGLADLYAGDKDYASASKLLARAIALKPADPTPRLQMVNLYRDQKKWPEALTEARALSTAFSRNVTVREMLGHVYLESGDVPNGLATYRDAIKVFPDSASLQARYAQVAAAAKVTQPQAQPRRN